MKRHAPDHFGATMLSAAFSIFSTAYVVKALGLAPRDSLLSRVTYKKCDSSQEAHDAIPQALMLGGMLMQSLEERRSLWIAAVALALHFKDLEQLLTENLLQMTAQTWQEHWCPQE